MSDPRWPELRALQPGVVPLGPLTPAEIFHAAITTLRRYAGLLFGTSFVVLAVTMTARDSLVEPMMRDLPPLPPQATPEQLSEYSTALMPITGIDAVFSTLAVVLISGIATVVVGKAVIGQRASFGDAWALLAPLLMPLLGLTVLVSLAVAAGLIAFVIPGVWIAVLLSLAAPALVLERSTIKQALVRSRDLVKNNWWRIFGILALLIVAMIGVNALFAMLLGTTTTDGSLFDLSLVVTIIAGTITAPFAAVVVALVYVDRRFHTDDLALELARAAGLR